MEQNAIRHERNTGEKSYSNSPYAATHKTRNEKCKIPNAMIPAKSFVVSDKVLGAEVSAEVDDLPRAQSNQHADRAKGEPLDSLVGALVGITETLLTGTQIVHLSHNIGNHLFDAAEVGLDGLELLLGLNAGPIAGIGANFNIELDITEGFGGAT